MTPTPNDRVGIALALGSCTALGLAIAVARYAYEGGANGLAVATIRVVVAFIGLLLFCVLTRRRLWPGRETWLHCAGLGVLVVGMTYGNVGSVEFIPVGLAALLFYTFPPMVAAGDALLERRLPAWSKLAAVAIAFAGLATMLGVSLGAVDSRGLVLALVAATSCAVHALWLQRKLRHVDAFVATLHMTLIAMVLMLGAWVVSGAARLPDSPIGWAGTLGVVVLQAGAMPLYIVAIQRIGALRCAVFANVQPVVSIVVAYLLFAEVLGPAQFLGGALVLTGIVLMQRMEGTAVHTVNTGSGNKEPL